jgi:zinc/manganese transport system substrate-binding protein
MTTRYQFQENLLVGASPSRGGKGSPRLATGDGVIARKTHPLGPRPPRPNLPLEREGTRFWFFTGIVTFLFSMASFIFASPAFALNVLATTPEWGALATEIGGDKVSVYVATTAFQDVHQIEAKPSLVARARNADLIIATGADLEVGWLPVLQRESANRKIQDGSPGYFEATRGLNLLDVPTNIDRSMGDVHALGNPHVHLDPRNLQKIANALAQRFGEIDRANKAIFDARNQSFQQRITDAIKRWESLAAPLRGLPVVVHHQDQKYLLHWLGMKEVAALESKPGIPPSTGHLSDLLQTLQREPAKLILRGGYNDPKPSNWLAQRSKIPIVTLPFTVGGSNEAKDLFGLFDDTIAKLLAGIKQ